MDETTKFRMAIAAIIVVSLAISGIMVTIIGYYVGFVVIGAEPGTITTMHIYDVRPAYYWHGFYGVAVMVQEFSITQRYTVDDYGVDLLNLLFPCLEYGEQHEIYAAPSPEIDWGSVKPATPEFIDEYFNITMSYMGAVNTFTENMTVELGNRNITNVPSTHTFVKSGPQQERFDLGILQDGNGVPIFVTHIEDFVEGFTGDVVNYQLMVARPIDEEITYYFFTDPFDSCPEGWGEREPPGNVTGVVTDKATGAPLAYTRVIVGGAMTVTSNNGTYHLSVEAGTYHIVALKVGYNNYVSNVTIFPGQETVKDIQMEKSQEQAKVTQAGGGGTGKGPGKAVGPGIGPYLEKPKKREGIDHFISTKEVKRTMRLNQFYEQEIYVFNYANKTAELNIKVEGDVSDKVEVDKTKLFVKPDSHESFKITIFGRGVPGQYNGSIKLFGTFDDKIPLQILLSSKEKLPIEALLLDVSPVTLRIYQGSLLKFKVDLRNLLTEERYNVTLSYYLKDPRYNLTTFLGRDNYPVKTSLSIIKSYRVPKDLPLGDKIVEVRADYLNVTTEARTVVTVVEPFYMYKLFGKVRVWWLFVLFALIILLTILIIYVRKKIEEKKRYHLKVAYKTLPQKGPPRNVYIGKIAESNKPAYFDLNKLTTHAIVAGSTGGGKTISAQVLVEECLKNNVAVVVFDPTAQWSGFLRKCESESMLKHYPKFGLKKSDARAFDGNVRQIQDAREKINLKKFFRPGEIQVFTIDKLDPRDIDVFVTNTVREVFHEHFDEAQELKYLMVYDEVHRLLPRFGGSGEGFIQIERACREFRKWGIGVLLVSQVLTDFASQIKANINTEIQMRTRDEGDLKRIATKYGKEVLRSLVKATVGTGMLENPAWNYGKPYFVTFRPILHSVHRLTDEELAKYNKYNQIIDDLEYQLEQLKDNGEDVFDLELELKLALDKVKSGNFNMVDIYLETLKPEVEKRWKKLGKKPKHREIELVDLREIQRAVEQARKEREKYLKQKQGTAETKATAEVAKQSKFEVVYSGNQAISFDNGLTAMSLNELIDVLEAMDDETYARHVNENKNDIADWVEKVVGDAGLAEKLRGKSRVEAIEVLKLAKMEEEKKQTQQSKSTQSETPVESGEGGSEGESEEEIFESDDSFDTSKFDGATATPKQEQPLSGVSEENEEEREQLP
ncbi:hypothetical protein DRJ48_02970, partial [Candidatus Woesearchaeota archaeon]